MTKKHSPLAIAAVTFAFLLSACDQEKTKEPLSGQSENLSTGKHVSLPSLDIEVDVTPRAQKQLKDLKERIKILVYVSHDHSEGPLLGEVDKFLSPEGGVSHIDAWQVKSVQELTPTYRPYTLVNVVSARDVCEDNLLSCSIYSGDYPMAEKTRLQIKCDVINENPQCKKKPSTLEQNK